MAKEPEDVRTSRIAEALQTIEDYLGADVGDVIRAIVARADIESGRDVLRPLKDIRKLSDRLILEDLDNANHDSD